MNADSTAPSGIMAGLSRLLKALIETAHTRLHLLALDLEEDRLYFLLMIKLMMVIAFCIAMALVLLTVLVAVVFWDNYRLMALACLSGGFFAMALVTWRYAAYKAKRKPALFSGSLGELFKDQQTLDSSSQSDKL